MQKRYTPERARVRILTVHPASRRIEGGLRDGGTIQITVIDVGPLFRWPVEGEQWNVVRRNNAWMLDGLIQDKLEDTPIEDLNPGDAKISSDYIYTRTSRVMTELDMNTTDVSRYGALGDGIADDRPSLQAAIDATEGNGVVSLNPGVYYLNSGGSLKLPMEASGLTIRGSGPATVIKLSTNCTTFLKPDRTADHQNFQNIIVEDLTVDGNNVGGVGNGSGVILSTLGVSQRINIDNVTLRRIKQVNVPVDENYTVNHRRSIYLASSHAAAGEATQNTITNILCEDIDLEGGNAGIEIYGTGVAAVGINVWLDNININRCRHDMMQIENSFFPHSSFHVGSRGTGNRVRIRDCYAYGGSDVSLEINSMTDILVDGCVMEGHDGNGFYFRNYNYPLDEAGIGAPSVSNNSLNRQKFIVTNCRSVFAPGRAGRGGRGFLASVETGGTDLPMGEVRFIDCTVVYDDPTLEPTQGSAFAIFGRCANVHMERCYARYYNVDLAAGGSAKSSSIFYIDKDNGTEHLYIRDCNAYVSGTVDAASTEINALTGLYLRGRSPSTYVIVDGFHWQASFTDWNGAVMYGAYLADGTIAGGLRNIRINFTNSTSDWNGIGINGTASLTLDNFAILDSNLKAADSGNEIVYLGATNAANVNRHNVRLNGSMVWAGP